MSACTLHLTFSSRCATRVHVCARTSLPYIRLYIYRYSIHEQADARGHVAPLRGFQRCQLRRAIVRARMHLHTLFPPVSEKLARPKIRPENSLSSHFRPRPKSVPDPDSNEAGWFRLVVGFREKFSPLRNSIRCSLLSKRNEFEDQGNVNRRIEPFLFKRVPRFRKEILETFRKGRRVSTAFLSVLHTPSRHLALPDSFSFIHALSVRDFTYSSRRAIPSS